MDYRIKKEFSVIRIPKPLVDEDRGLIECCCSFSVIADLGSNDSWKNDVKGVFVKKTTNSDTVTFSISKCGTVLSNLGTVAVFPNEPLAVGFIFDWKQYLSAHGNGIYKISVSQTISGVSDTYDIGAFDLQQFTTERLDETCRIRSKFNSYNVELNMDFTGSNFVDDLRFPGFFGARKPNPEIKNLIDKGRRMVKTTREFVNSYELTAEPLSSCLSGSLLDLHLLNEDECFITDHNISNHSYQYNDFPVVLNGVDTEYPGQSRLMRLTAQFNNRLKNQKSMYNVV